MFISWWNIENENETTQSVNIWNLPLAKVWEIWRNDFLNSKPSTNCFPISQIHVRKDRDQRRVSLCMTSWLDPNYPASDNYMIIIDYEWEGRAGRWSAAWLATSDSNNPDTRSKHFYSSFYCDVTPQWSRRWWSWPSWGHWLVIKTRQ